jgi:hypothetical protein
MSINFRGLLHGKLMISETHGHTTNYYVISIIPILVALLILALISAIVITMCNRPRE